MTFDPRKSTFGDTVITLLGTFRLPAHPFADGCYKVWPDLPNGACVVIIPKDDFLALLEELRDQPFITTRPFLTAELPPRRPTPQATSPVPTKRSLIAELLRKARGR